VENATLRHFDGLDKINVSFLVVVYNGSQSGAVINFLFEIFADFTENKFRGLVKESPDLLSYLQNSQSINFIDKVHHNLIDDC
jgi:hypothetical protein